MPRLDGDLTGGAPTTLQGLLFKPVGPGPFPAVVGMHGCGGLFNKQGHLVARETAWAEILTSRGYVVLFPDIFGPRNIVHAVLMEVRTRAPGPKGLTTPMVPFAICSPSPL